MGSATLAVKTQIACDLGYAAIQIVRSTKGQEEEGQWVGSEWGSSNTAVNNSSRAQGDRVVLVRS